MTKKNLHSQKNTFEPSYGFHVETLPVSAIKFDKKHPVIYTDIMVEKTAAVASATKYVHPPLLDSTHKVVGGGEWVKASELLGMSEMKVLVLDPMSKDKLLVMAMAYQNMPKYGKWDEENLKEGLRYLIDAEYKCEIDYPITATAFEIGEIDIILGEKNQPEEELTFERLELDLEKPVVSKLGYEWVLGKHRIICGNSLDLATHTKLLTGIMVQLLCSDFPYNVKIPGFASGNGAVKHADFAMASGEMSLSEFDEFLYCAILHSIARLDDGSCVYLTTDWRHLDQFQAAAKRCGLTLLNICVWDKGVGGMGSLYRSQHEFCLVYRKGSTQHRNNVMLGKYKRNRTNLWQYPSANTSKEGREALKDHPTPKPVAMISDIILDVTKPNDVVFDPFLGGGTAVLSAEKTGRRCYGIELDPRYIDVTIRRWQKLTGEQAVHVETGLTFAELESVL